ncbi:redoxin domain-containing protein [Thermoplasmatota archaeon]
MTNEEKNLVDNKAFNFVLKDHNKEEFKLSDYKGKKILLSFHPLAWTGICAEQMKSLEKNFEIFKELNTIAFGVNIDSIPSKNAWAKSLNIKNTSLLSDFWPHGEVAKLYHIFREKEGFSERANIIINENQKIIYAKIYEISQLPDINEIISFLKKNFK